MKVPGVLRMRRTSTLAVLLFSLLSLSLGAGADEGGKGGSEDEELDFIREHQCTSVSKDVDCGGDSGIFYRMNGGDWNSVHDPSHELPLSVPPNGQLFLTVCNIANSQVEDAASLSETLIPTLVKGVGSGGSLVVFVLNSANTMVTSSARIAPFSSERLALLSSIVEGPIGRRAAVFVAIRNSGNVFLKEKAHGLEAFQSDLVANPVHDGSQCTRDACIQVEISDSANVMGRRGGRAEVRLGADASLLHGAVSTSCVEGGTQFAYIRRSGNIHDAQAVSMDNAMQLRPVLTSGNVKSTELAVRVINSANVEARAETQSTSSWLTGGLVELQSGTQTTILVGAKNVANMRTAKYRVIGGGALGPLVSLEGGTDQAHVAVMAVNVGNVDAVGDILLKQGMVCLSSLLRTVGASTKTRAQVALQASCNVRGSDLEMWQQSRLVSTAVTIARTTELLVSVKVERSANTYIVGTVALHNSALIQRLVSVGNTLRSVLVLAIGRRSGNLECGHQASKSFVNDASKLVINAVDFEALAPSADVKVGVQLQVFGNAFAKLKDSRQLVDDMFVSPRGVTKIHMHKDYVGRELSCKS